MNATEMTAIIMDDGSGCVYECTVNEHGEDDRQIEVSFVERRRCFLTASGMTVDAHEESGGDRLKPLPGTEEGGGDDFRCTAGGD